MIYEVNVLQSKLLLAQTEKCNEFLFFKVVCELHRSLEVAPIIRNIKYVVGRVNYTQEAADNNKYSNEKQNPTASYTTAKWATFENTFLDNQEALRVGNLNQRVVNDVLEAILVVDSVYVLSIVLP